MSKWYTEAFFYHIYPLGLCGAELENPALKGEDAAEISIDAHGFQRATDLLNREDSNIYAHNGRFSFPVSPA